MAETLIAVLETGSFTAAARRLEVSQSTVSRRIAALERRLGDRPLLTRNSRWIAATETAETYVRDVRLVLSQLDAADASAHERGGEPAGLVRLSTPPALTRAKLLRPLAELQRRLPKLRLSLDLSEQYVDLREGAFDVVVRIRPLEQTDVEQEQLASYPLLCCASPTYLSQRGAPKRVSELAGRDFIGVSARDGGAAAFLEDGVKSALRRITPSIMTNDVAAALELARAGYGICVAPLFLVEDDLRSGAIAPCLEGVFSDPLNVYALYPRNIRDAPRVKVVLETLREALQTPQ